MPDINVKINVNSDSAEEDIKNLKKAFNLLGDTAQSSGNKVKTSFNRALSGLTNLVRGFKRGLSTIKSSFKTLIGTIGNFIGIATFEEVIRATQKLSSSFISVENALTAVTRSNKVASKSLEFLRKEAQFLGADFNILTTAYQKYSAAAVKTRLTSLEVHDMFSALAETGVILQFSTQQLEGAFRAITQMMSKGRVQAEELRGQLGEHLPGAFEIAAESMGLTTAELDEMLKQGQVTADMLLSNFAGGLRDAYGKALPGAIRTSTAEFSRLRNEITLFIFENRKGFDQFFAKVGRGLREMVQGIKDSGILKEFSTKGTGLDFIIEKLRTLPQELHLAFVKLKADIKIITLEIKRMWLEIRANVFNDPDSAAALRGNIRAISGSEVDIMGTIGNIFSGNRQITAHSNTYREEPTGEGSMDEQVRRAYEARDASVQKWKSYYADLAKRRLGESSVRGEDPGITTAAFVPDPSRLEKRLKIFSAAIGRVHDDWDNGKTSLEEYNNELAETITEFQDVANIGSKTFAGLRAGASQFASEYGNHVDNIGTWSKDAFEGMTDAITDSLATGENAFRAFADAILQDLLRIYIRASIVLPIAQQLGFAGPIGGGGIGGTQDFLQPVNSDVNIGFTAAKPMAQGGVLRRPTNIIAAEAGPEAVLPLHRLAELGGSTEINIINNTSSEISQTSTTGPDGKQIIDIMVENKINDMVQSGKMDSTLSPYNVRRPGQR